ncbi:unnamed protein product [Calypogeia fissa]
MNMQGISQRCPPDPPIRRPGCNSTNKGANAITDEVSRDFSKMQEDSCPVSCHPKSRQLPAGHRCILI